MVLIAHNIRSTHNVGSLLRTAEGLGVEEIYLTGYTPYPLMENDARLPHLAAKLDKQIAKTALGAQKSAKWFYSEELKPIVEALKSKAYKLVALEQAANTRKLHEYKPPKKLALVVGNEIDGLHESDLQLVDEVIEIAMLGKKESFNVAIAAGIALHHLRHV